MLKKGRTLALGVAIAGAMGLGAPMASAATLQGQPGSGISQQELQNCANEFYSKVLSGTGSALSGNVVSVQRSTTGWAFITGLLSNGATTVTAVSPSSGCTLTTQQVTSLYCAGALPTSTVTTTQMPTNIIAALLAALGQNAVTTTTTTSNLGNLCSK